jgi:hypothetical protein
MFAGPKKPCHRHEGTRTASRTGNGNQHPMRVRGASKMRLRFLPKFLATFVREIGWGVWGVVGIRGEWRGCMYAGRMDDVKTGMRVSGSYCA